MFKPLRKNVIDFTVYIIARCLICLIQMTSLERCDYFCRFFALIFSKYLPLRRCLVDSNLKLVFRDWSETKIAEVRFGMWHHLLLMVCEICLASRKVHRSNWHDHFSIPNRGQVLRFIFDSRAKIFVTGHFGNFELAGFVTGLFGIQNTTIARPLDNKFVHRYFNQFRSQGGQHFIDKDGSSAAIQELLDEGGTLALLADQHAGDRGVWVDFLGVPASCHKALSLFTLQSNAPMMVIANRRVGGPLQFELSIEGLADPKNGGEELAGVTQLTQWYNQALEQVIRTNPEQYWWVHRRWRERPLRIKKTANQAA